MRYGDENALKLDQLTGVWAIKAVWAEVPAVRETLQNFAQKITNNDMHMQDRDFNEGDNYKKELINSILNFIQNLSIGIIGQNTLEYMNNSRNNGVIKK